MWTTLDSVIRPLDLASVNPLFLYFKRVFIATQCIPTFGPLWDERDKRFNTVYLKYLKATFMIFKDFLRL